MWIRLMGLARRANRVLWTEGFGAFITKLFRYLTRVIYTNDTYLIFEHTLEHTDYGDLTPKGTVVDLRVICSLEELVHLSAEGYDLSRLNLTRARRYLSKQGMLFCIFIGGRVAHQSWVSTDCNADIDLIAPHVKYEGSAYIGACQTWPEYQGLGLYPYTLSEICKVLKSRRLSKAILTVAPDNTSSIVGVTKAGFQRHGTGRLVRILLTLNYWITKGSEIKRCQEMEDAQ